MLNFNQNNYTIPAKSALPLSQNYEAMRALGIEHIQKLSNQLWTDFNVHDPGVTVLELLCYALTDLGYRTNFNIKDILTKPETNNPISSDSFFTARDILTFHPITKNDYRKLILDQVKGVQNVWIQPIESVYKPNVFVAKNHAELTFTNENTNPPLTIGGLYNVKIELENTEGLEFKTASQADIGKVKIEVHNQLMAHRNLCEDFNCVETVEFEYVGICADIELHKTANPVDVKKAIYKTIYAYITPQLRFYTIKQLLEKGKTIEEIFQGSVAQKGFLDYDELDVFETKKVLYTSDIINLLMNIEGIKSIRKFHFASYQFKQDNNKIEKITLKDSEKYCLHLTDPNKVFRFRLDILDDKNDLSHINKFSFYFDDLQVPIKVQKTDELLNFLISKQDDLLNFQEDLPALLGTNRDLERHYSIQNELPKTYSLGQEGIAEQSPTARKSQRLQMKGYLMFFEQIMADYLSQLNHVSDLLSWSDSVDERSYFTQKLSEPEIVDLEKIKNKGFDDLFLTDSKGYTEKVLGQNEKERFTRRNRFLNHLIARFNDSFVEFSIAQFIQHSSNHTYQNNEIIDDKKAFLKTFPKHSGDRPHAFNYIETVWGTDNLSGFELRIEKKLGLSKPKNAHTFSLVHPIFEADGTLKDSPIFIDNRNERFDDIFGFHLIEHHLLRPRWGADKKRKEIKIVLNKQADNIREELKTVVDEVEKKRLKEELKIIKNKIYSIEEFFLDICEDPHNFNPDCFCRDPYSFKATMVLPGWFNISMDMNFRKYIEKMIREELPAHISLKICWIGVEEMLEFEKSYYAFTNCLRAFSKSKTCYEVTEQIFEPKYVLSLNEMITTIKKLNNIYPPSLLVECEDIELDENNNPKKRPVILGKTALKDTQPRDIWDKSGKVITEEQLKLEQLFFEKESGTM